MRNATQTVTVTPPVTGGPDKTPPALSITSPASTILQTSQSTIAVTGTSSSNSGIAKVTWRNVLSGSGTATGTTAWSASGIPLYSGTNTLILTAVDKAGNTSWRSLTVVRH